MSKLEDAQREMVLFLSGVVEGMEQYRDDPDEDVLESCAHTFARRDERLSSAPWLEVEELLASAVDEAIRRSE